VLAVWLVVILVLLALGGVSLFVRRHGEAGVPAGDWTPTPEVFVDPGTGRRMRVWTDPRDGTRHYVPEGHQPGAV
jgi:hypothetical protein